MLLSLKKHSRFAITAFAFCSLALLGQTTVAQDANPNDAKTKDVLLDRTRREVRMLDDLYKGAIVAITQHYVNDKQTIPAGTAFKSLFVAVEKKGWHKVRLIDVSGEPYSDENVAEDDFEKMAVKALAAGKANVESIEVRDGTRHLRVATPIPVVFEKCVMCHDNYADVPKGKAIGALSYTMPIDGPLVLKATEKDAAKK